MEERGMTRDRLVGAAACILAACLPWRAAAIDEQEQRERLQFESQRFEEAIAKQGLLYGDPALDAYLQSVTDRMFPELPPGALRVRAIRDEEMNAFALPSGAIYVNTGALLRMRNEAELASLLGHEVTHVTAEHSLEGTRSGKTIAGTAMVLSGGVSAGLGPLITQLVAYSTMAGFSRGREREADELGLQRMTRAGYDTSAMATFFDRVQREFTARKIKQGLYAFATHPRFQSRVEAASTEPPGDTPGVVRRDEYMAATSEVRPGVLEALRDKRQGTALTFLLGDEGMVEEYVPAGRFLLGEGYRLRAEAGDAERAAEQYRLSIERSPDYAPAWGALGRHYARTGNDAQALQCLEHYLELAPDARDAPFTRQAVEKLRHGAPPTAEE
jgi:predicted Zn-dependent protease